MLFLRQIDDYVAFQSSFYKYCEKSVVVMLLGIHINAKILIIKYNVEIK